MNSHSPRPGTGRGIRATIPYSLAATGADFHQQNWTLGISLLPNFRKCIFSVRLRWMPLWQCAGMMKNFQSRGQILCNQRGGSEKWGHPLPVLTEKSIPLHSSFLSGISAWIRLSFLTTYLLHWICPWWLFGILSLTSLQFRCLLSFAMTLSLLPLSLSEWLAAEPAATLFWWCDWSCGLPWCCSQLSLALQRHKHNQHYFQSRVAGLCGTTS